MNDRAVALLEQYDIEVVRTKKGRGGILCDTPKGALILKEYAGNEARLLLQDGLLWHIREQGQVRTDTLVPTKEGKLWVKDRDGICYILKTYYEGRECNIHDREECLLIMRLLAKLHNSMEDYSWKPEKVLLEQEDGQGMPTGTVTAAPSPLQEYEKHNRELLSIRSYLYKKGQKQLFERRLQSVMDIYMEQAKETTRGWKAYVQQLKLQEPEHTCFHGDYQYHNVILYNGEWYVVNFEKCRPGSRMKDVYLLLRKLLEKSDWSAVLGRELLEAYGQIRPLSAVDCIDLYYRLSYPEKFWKIANFYYNSRKAWIPERNMEKLEKLLEQEEAKQDFLKTVFTPASLSEVTGGAELSS